MQFDDIVRVALSSLRANKLRSFLTVLGIVIGIASVISVVALGTGARAAVQERIARLGTTLIQVNPRRVRMVGVASENPRSSLPTTRSSFTPRRRHRSYRRPAIRIDQFSAAAEKI